MQTEPLSSLKDVVKKKKKEKKICKKKKKKGLHDSKFMFYCLVSLHFIIISKKKKVSTLKGWLCTLLYKNKIVYIERFSTSKVIMLKGKCKV